MRKIVIVGGVAGGAGTAARLRRLDENLEITMFERGDYISFANCGLPYYVGNVIEERDELLVMTPELMRDRFQIDVRVRHEVTSIDRQEKCVAVKNLKTGEETVFPYDTLVLATGSAPFIPDVPGVEDDRIFTLWNMRDVDRIKNYMTVHSPKRAAVIGGGFIGMEMVENLHLQGVEVSLIEMLPQVMPNLDQEMSNIIHRILRENQVNLMLGEQLQAFEAVDGGLLLKLASGKTVEVDMVIMAVGVRPNSQLAANAGLELNARKGIVVNQHLQTSDPDIYALGDVIEVYHYVTQDKVMIPLAGPANKQGRICADNICGIPSTYIGSMGASIAKVFNLSVGSVGLNEKQLKAAGKIESKDYFVAKSHPFSSATYYPAATPMTLKVLYLADGTVIGASAVGNSGVDKRLDVIATCMHFKGTVYDLKDLELCYAPPFSSAKDPVNMIGFMAENRLTGVCDFASWAEYTQLDPDVVTLLDVREADEVEMGKVDGAVHIPLHSLRHRLHELDINKPVFVYCGVGIRAYIACRILKQNDFTAINVSGGYKSYVDYIG